MKRMLIRYSPIDSMLYWRKGLTHNLSWQSTWLKLAISLGKVSAHKWRKNAPRMSNTEKNFILPANKRCTTPRPHEQDAAQTGERLRQLHKGSPPAGAPAVPAPQGGGAHGDPTAPEPGATKRGPPPPGPAAAQAYPHRLGFPYRSQRAGPSPRAGPPLSARPKVRRSRLTSTSMSRKPPSATSKMSPIFVPDGTRSRKHSSACASMLTK